MNSERIELIIAFLRDIVRQCPEVATVADVETFIRDELEPELRARAEGEAEPQRYAPGDPARQNQCRPQGHVSIGGAGVGPARPAPSGWIPVSERLPADETPVMILRNGELRIGELRWEKPTYEETFNPFQYWDDPNNDGQTWEWDEVTHWMPLPAAPEAK